MRNRLSPIVKLAIPLQVILFTTACNLGGGEPAQEEAKLIEGNSAPVAGKHENQPKGFDLQALIYDRSQFERDIRQAVSATLDFWYTFEKTDCEASGFSISKGNCYRLIEDGPSVTRWDRFVSVEARMRLLRSLVYRRNFSSGSDQIELGSVFYVNNDELAKIIDSQMSGVTGDVKIPVGTFRDLKIDDTSFRTVCASDGKEHPAVGIKFDLQPAKDWSEEFLSKSAPQSLNSNKFVCFNVFDGLPTIVDLALGFNQ